MPRVSQLPLASSVGTVYVIEGGVSKRIVVGTMALQAASAVAITGGTIAGLSSLGVNGTPTFNTNVGYIGKAGSGLGGNWRYIDDTGASRWLTGLLGTAAATAFVVFDVVAGATRLEVSSAGVVNLPSAVLQMAGVQVVGTRKAGWAAATGTPTRTTFATGSVTTAQLAERVKALIDDLISHGLIGT